MQTHYDVIVVGGGHAGIEAAWAASGMGARTALITMSREAIGRMSCNPAIGGLGKGQMVREVDALGGLMGLATDRAGIQFRFLNRSKGPAVQAPRAQADRGLYARATQDLLVKAGNLTIVEGLVERILTRPEFHQMGRAAPAASAPVPSDDDGNPTGQARRHADGPIGCRAGDSASAGFDSEARALGATEQQAYEKAGIASEASRVMGVELADGRILKADAVILTTGTFLRGLMHCGEKKAEGGRVGEAAAAGISRSLLELGFELGRLKTGTPPRIHRDSVDYDACEIQPGDEVPMPFSFMNDGLRQRQVNCWITYTNPDIHELIRANLHRAPMYCGQIQSTGPRYCPSIEDKVIRFADKERHQLFLEPEGYDDERIYCNGISTSLPSDVQEAIVRRIPGLEHARILQHGYAVEYDWVPTHQTRYSLETKRVRGLFLAGQINGTSGYEEAAAQGIIAGINAVQSLRGQAPLVLSRDQAYIGVMIDDLISRPHREPYRMFTSRAEFRLSLRSDNADRRLTSLGRKAGLVCDQRWARYSRKIGAIARIEAVLPKARIRGRPAEEWLRRPQATVEELAAAIHAVDGSINGIDDLEQVLIRVRYQGYLDRQERQVERLQRMESLRIPEHLDFRAVRNIKEEARQNLARVHPRTLGQASRIPGITPADLTVLWVAIKAGAAS